jgi:hypothetical protein
MAIVLPETDVINELVVMGHERGIITEASFDPAEVTKFVNPNSAEENGSIFLQDTEYMPIPSLGFQTVALFNRQGPAKSRANTEDIIHRSAHQGILIRRPYKAEAETLPPEMNPRLAWIFELVVPSPGEPGTANKTMLQKPFMRRTI